MEAAGALQKTNILVGRSVTEHQNPVSLNVPRYIKTLKF